MISKLSKTQKEFLKYSYFGNCVISLPKPTNISKSKYNSKRRSVHLLIKRGLVEQYNDGKYVKQTVLTLKGIKIAEGLLLNDNSGFTLNATVLYQKLNIMTAKKYFVYLHLIIKNRKIKAELLDKHYATRYKFYFENVCKKIQGNDEIVLKIQHLKEDLKRYVGKSSDRQIYVISIKKNDSLIWLHIDTINKSWDFYGVYPKEFIPQFINPRNTDVFIQKY